MVSWVKQNRRTLGLAWLLFGAGIILFRASNPYDYIVGTIFTAALVVSFIFHYRVKPEIFAGKPLNVKSKFFLFDPKLKGFDGLVTNAFVLLIYIWLASTIIFLFIYPALMFLDSNIRISLQSSHRFVTILRFVMTGSLLLFIGRWITQKTLTVFKTSDR